MIDEQRRAKFLGSLLGTAIGDAVGASREGYGMAQEQQLKAIAQGTAPLRYTDDTHMTIGITESLLACRGFSGADMARHCYMLCKKFTEILWLALKQQVVRELH